MTVVSAKPSLRALQNLFEEFALWTALWMGFPLLGQARPHAKREEQTVTTHRAKMLAGLACSTVLVVLAIVPTASAITPKREINPAQEDVLIADQCAFPVFAHFDGPEVLTTFFDKAKNSVKLLGVFPGHTLTLTNPATGTSITVGATGPFHLRLEVDGSGSAMVTGQGAWPGNPVTGQSGIWYQSGRVSTSWDADGNTTSLESSGTLVDLCPQLAR